MAQVSALWRYPIKSHGAEALDAVTVTAGHTLPFDRTWAVAHEAAKTDGSAWAPCANYSRGAKAPALMAITAETDEATSRVTLRHPDRPDLSFAPDDPADLAAFLDWTAPLMPTDRAASARIDRVPGRGMTDSDFPSISLIGTASLAALSDRLGTALDQRRFRANIWVDDLPAFAEFDMVGDTLEIGGVRFRVAERITRCLATTANPETGVRDADTLGALEAGWGHRDLGVYLVAESDGTVSVGDALTR